MNLGFYGHTNTIVYTSTAKDGKHVKTAELGGIRQIHRSATAPTESDTIEILANHDADPNSTEYRKDYYEKWTSKTTDSGLYYASCRYLGYEDGTTENNIFFEQTDDTSAVIDTLFVWDGGYGGLNIPDAKHILWASDAALPDRNEFEKIADKCFLFLDCNVLRKTGAMISKQISWEKTTADIIMELQSNSAISYILGARHLLISIGVDGAVYIKNGELRESALLLTHGKSEDTIVDEYPNGLTSMMIFNFMTTTFMTPVAKITSLVDAGVIPNHGHDDVFANYMDAIINLLVTNNQRSTEIFENAENSAVRWGAVLRTVLEAGETMVRNDSYVDEETATGADSGKSRSRQMEMRDWPAFHIPLEHDGVKCHVTPDWTITNSVGLLSDIAFDYVQNGATAIDGLPQLSFGNFTTIDRWEIEAYQNIRNLILDYANSETTRPLSIAVFGSPGSGKSFGVTEIAKNILPGKIEKLEFNVSQFTSLSDLGAAFQKVRDTIVTGKLPLVFFDEFDSDRDGVQLGWLKTFLMPMQDGKFRDDSGEHPLGRCILVFAGGTAATFEEFAYDNTNFKNIKGPDFVSRLRGTINVLGPNAKDENDKNHILRRALLLRSLVQRHGISAVSSKIIHALLHVPEYKHGARSMEAILDMSRIDGSVWEPVSLPSHSQLSLHVDAEAFVKLVLEK